MSLEAGRGRLGGMKKGTETKEHDVEGALAAALRRLGRERPFETLSVRDIAREAGVSTRTFYNHYRSKYDLVIRFYAWNDEAAVRAARAGAPLPPWPEQVRDGLVRFRRDRAMFAGAMRDMAGPEGFGETLLEHACRTMADYAELRTGRPLPDALAPVLRLYAAGVVRLVCEWLLSPAPQSVDDFLGVLVAALPAPLREILL